MGTGARTPKPDDYPGQLGEALTSLRAAGVKSFAQAWDSAIAHLGIPEGWNHAYPGQPDETPLAFARRHFAAAWEGREAERYCQAESCYERTERRYCPAHGREAVAA